MNRNNKLEVRFYWDPVDHPLYRVLLAYFQMTLQNIQHEFRDAYAQAHANPTSAYICLNTDGSFAWSNYQRLMGMLQDIHQECKHAGVSLRWSADLSHMRPVHWIMLTEQYYQGPDAEVIHLPRLAGKRFGHGEQIRDVYVLGERNAARALAGKLRYRARYRHFALESEIGLLRERRHFGNACIMVITSTGRKKIYLSKYLQAIDAMRMRSAKHYVHEPVKLGDLTLLPPGAHMTCVPFP